MDPLWNNYRPLFGANTPNQLLLLLQLLADDANSHYVVGGWIYSGNQWLPTIARLEKAFCPMVESPITSRGQQLREGKMAISDKFKPRWQWSANDCFKTENSSISTKKKEKLKLHHNWELSGNVVMLQQLSCLLYSFHVKAVSPKYCLLWCGKFICFSQKINFRL